MSCPPFRYAFTKNTHLVFPNPRIRHCLVVPLVLHLPKKTRSSPFDVPPFPTSFLPPRKLHLYLMLSLPLLQHLLLPKRPPAHLQHSLEAFPAPSRIFAEPIHRHLFDLDFHSLPSAAEGCDAGFLLESGSFVFVCVMVSGA